MIKNTLIIAWRNLTKNRVYSVINLLGLAAGLAGCLIIGVYVQHELSYDRYHEKGDRIFRLANQVAGASYENGIAKVSGPWGPEAKRSIPEVEAVCRFVFFGQALVEKGEKRFYESGGLYADSSVFDMFSWPLLEGNAPTALAKPNTIVISESFATRYFGEQNPVGSIITINQDTEYRVTGIVEDVPSNSHFTFDFLVSMASYSHPDMDDWLRWNQFYTYLLLGPGGSPELVAGKIDDLIGRHIDEQTSNAYTPFLQPLTDIHLKSHLHREMAANSDIGYVYVFSAIALFILFIASLNFINLATARAMHRSKEVGIRKVNGATRRGLIFQFIGESVFMVSIAAVLGVAFAEFFLPVVRDFLVIDLRFAWMHNYWLTGGLAAMVFLVGLLSGIYPALLLSSFRPVRVLKGRMSFSGNPVLRKSLVVFQFVIAVFLISATLIVSGQLQYINNKDLGFNKEQIVLIPMRSDQVRQKIPSIKEQLMQIPGVLEVSASGNGPGGGDWGIPYQAVGLPPNQQPAMRCLVVDSDFLETYEMEIVEGRGFSAAMVTDSLAYLINETAARQLGWEDPVGQMLALPAIDRPAGPIIGVVKDFHFRSMHENIDPLYFFMQPVWYAQFSVRVAAANMEETLAGIEKQWNIIEPEYPFEYTFFDEMYGNLHQAEQRTATIVRWFAVLAVILTCLGLLGLSIFTTERRTKEIGIRKVLGASESRIFALLASDFLRLVLLGCVLAIPAAWLFTRRWLEGFAFHIELSIWYFLLAGSIALVIALISVSWQSSRAARTDPVKALRYE